MCTVTFLAIDDAFILTSNRDEQTVRAAIPPQQYFVNNQTLVFPKDPKAGGTWFAVSQSGIVIVLLNGAKEKHVYNPPYQRSRGVVVLEIASKKNPIAFWSEVDLHNVEPFTLILFQNKKLFELRWNGKEKSKKSLNVNDKHIYSSSTLYAKDVREQRAKWFYDYIASKKAITKHDLLDFHQNSHSANTQNGLVINRSDNLKTLSITQSIIKDNSVDLIYQDLINNEIYNEKITMTT